MLAALPPPTPGPYAGSGKASLLRANGQQYLLQATNISSGASIAVQLERLKTPYFYPWGVSFEITFSGAPGTFQIDVQTSDTDQSTSYVTIASLNGGLNSNNVGRVELTNLWAKYVRVNVTTLTNLVTVTALVTR